jgi:aspartate 1-decarboxylase
MMKSKIHRATVTQADLHYVGSVTVDEGLIGYGQMETDDARAFRPHVVFVDADNRVVGTGADPAQTFGAPHLVRGDSTG